MQTTTPYHVISDANRRLILGLPRGEGPLPVGREPVDKLAVVAGDQKRRRAADQLVFQLLFAFQVDMVGRLVENEKIGWLSRNCTNIIHAPDRVMFGMDNNRGIS